MMSDVVIDYEKEHYPIGKPTVAQLILLSLDEKKMSQKQLATEIGVSPSRISDYNLFCLGHVGGPTLLRMQKKDRFYLGTALFC